MFCSDNFNTLSRFFCPSLIA
jgi:hypothetical protein